jgi:hypothetical protein
MDVTAPGRELHARFLALGDMTGMNMGQIVAAVGRPTSISALAHGANLLQWQATGCHMALVFAPDDQFVKISHQYANYAAAPEGGCAVVFVILIIFAVVVYVIVMH